MTTISICVGSACHLKGAHGVLHAFATLLEKHQVAGKIDMEGCFCQGRCTEGVVIKINNEMITNVTKDQVYNLFLTRVLMSEQQ